MSAASNAERLLSDDELAELYDAINADDVEKVKKHLGVLSNFATHLLSIAVKSLVFNVTRFLFEECQPQIQKNDIREWIAEVEEASFEEEVELFRAEIMVATLRAYQGEKTQSILFSWHFLLLPMSSLVRLSGLSKWLGRVYRVSNKKNSFQVSQQYCQ